MGYDALAFLRGVAVHAGRVMTFRSDGTGLPKRPGGALYALIVIAVLMTSLRYALAPEIQHPMVAGASALLVIMCAAMLFGEQRLPCFSMYLCLRAGIDMTAMIVGDWGWYLGVWEIAGTAYGWYRFERRAHRPVI